MPIPELSPQGFLPEGLHDCTIDEVIERFGRFQTSDRRPELAASLISYHQEASEASIGKCLIINGSFVTSVDKPGDVDLLLVLKDDVYLKMEVPPFQYNVRSRKYVKRNYKLDFYVGFEQDDSYASMVTLFQQVKHQPGHRKGVLKVAL